MPGDIREYRHLLDLDRLKRRRARRDPSTGPARPSSQGLNDTIVAQPIGLAGVGAMLHHVMPSVLRTNWPQKKLDEVVALLTSVDWSRGPHWDGVAGEWVVRDVHNEDGEVTGTVERLSLGGVKEYGHAMIDALDASSPEGTRIRRRS
jgi:hypothetical protein